MAGPFEPSIIRDETDDALSPVFAFLVLVRDAVGSPPEDLDVEFVEDVLVCGCSCSDVGLGNTAFQSFVMLVLGVIVGVVLPDKIGQVADDDGDGRPFLKVHPS